MYPFFAMLSRMKYINRWGLMRNTRSENICEHSLEVALVAHALATIGNKKFGKSYDPQRAALLAVLHDAPEIITGDMPTPVKYHSEEIRKAYGEVEDMAVEHLVSMLPPELRDEYREIMTMSGQADQALKPLVKAADKISAVIKCVEERRSGNRDFSKAEKILAFNSPLMQLAVYTCILLISWFGARMIVSETMTTGQLMSLITYTTQILMSLMMLSMIFVMIIISRASAERIVEDPNTEALWSFQTKCHSHHAPADKE